jgi:glycine/D-amino acid oxidase-like deaminating enzyme
MRILVLGAGVVGVAAAWYLAEDGHDVTVILISTALSLSVTDHRSRRNRAASACRYPSLTPRSLLPPALAART